MPQTHRTRQPLQVPTIDVLLHGQDDRKSGGDAQFVHVQGGVWLDDRPRGHVHALRHAVAAHPALLPHKAVGEGLFGAAGALARLLRKLPAVVIQNGDTVLQLFAHDGKQLPDGRCLEGRGRQHRLGQRKAQRGHLLLAEIAQELRLHGKLAGGGAEVHGSAVGCVVHGLFAVLRPRLGNGCRLLGLLLFGEQLWVGVLKHGAPQRFARLQHVLRLGGDVVLAAALGALGGHDCWPCIGRQDHEVLQNHGGRVGLLGVHPHELAVLVADINQDVQGLGGREAALGSRVQLRRQLLQHLQLPRVEQPGDDRAHLGVLGLGGVAAPAGKAPPANKEHEGEAADAALVRGVAQARVVQLAHRPGAAPAHGLQHLVHCVDAEHMIHGHGQADHAVVPRAAEPGVGTGGAAHAAVGGAQCRVIGPIQLGQVLGVGGVVRDDLGRQLLNLRGGQQPQLDGGNARVQLPRHHSAGLCKVGPAGRDHPRGHTYTDDWSIPNISPNGGDNADFFQLDQLDQLGPTWTNLDQLGPKFAGALHSCTEACISGACL